MNNPLPPPRPALLKAAGYDGDPSKARFRDVVEWHKNVVRTSNTTAPGELTKTEFEAVQSTWATLIAAVAKRESIPAGFLSYMLDQLAQTELRMTHTALQEYEQATDEVQAALEAAKGDQNEFS